MADIKNSNQNPLFKAWWKEPKDQAHRLIFDVISRIHMQQSARMDRNLRALQLYGNSDSMLGGAPYTYSQLSRPALPDNRVKVNIISSMCDTVSAKIGKMKPRVSFLTDGGDAMTQEQAKKLNKYMMGAFYKNDIYAKHREMFTDSTIFDIGAIKHYIQDGEIKSERVMAMELYVDLGDSLYGKPMGLYQVKYIQKDILIEQFPEMRGAINSSAHTIDSRGLDNKTNAEFVIVMEAWHLPINKDGKDGRHVICVQNGTLLDEGYKKDYFPFTFMRWSNMRFGFWGQSLADRLTGNQIEINKMLRIIQKSFHLGSAFKVFLEFGSKVAKEHINNEIGSIVYYTGQKPEFYVPKTVNEEYFRHLEWLIKSSYEEAGISQMSSQSLKPAGLDSGVALREYQDIETERFALVSQMYESTFLETARQYIDLSKELADEGEDFKVVAQSKKFIETIKWSEVDIEHNEYIMQMFPVSMLPHEPAGRLQFVQELMKEGMIPADYGLQLLDFPDLDPYLSLKTAAVDDLMDTLSNILTEGKYQSPEPLQDLAQGVKLFQSAYLKAKNQKVPQEKLELILRWMSQAQAMLDQADQAAQAQQMAMQQAQGPQGSQPQPAPQQIAPQPISPIKTQ